ncbi:hypothetical protein B7463_g11871, partial [Scytalidium lignicola]
MVPATINSTHYRDITCSKIVLKSNITNNKLVGQVALITGAGGGFGESFAKRFAAEGAKVVIAKINFTAGKQVEQEIRSTHGEDSETALKSTLQKFGKLDILINNASTTHPKKPSHDITEDKWSKVIDVNMKSIYLSFAVIIPYFREQKKGVVLNISSIGGLRAKDQLVYYGASKAFVNKMTKGLAAEYGTDGIQVNSICPLLGYTGLTEIFTGVKATPEFRAKFAASIPLKRGLDHEDLANAAVFLCSSDASFVTGQNLAVDGGSTCMVN